MYCCSKQIGSRLTTWSFSAFFVSISIGVFVFPSILGAYIMGLICLFGMIKLLSNQPAAWRSVVWPLMNTFLSIILVGRLGCWFAGCCFGEVSDLPWAVQYAGEGFVSAYHFDRYHHHATDLSLAVHPVQLYESLGLVGVLGLSFWFKSLWGQVSSACLSLAFYLGVYAVINPFKAYLNNMSSLVYYGPLSKLQLVLLCIILLLILMAYYFRDSKDKAIITLDKNNLLIKSISLTDGLILWISLSAAAGLSITLGTPLSAKLSIFGAFLSAVAFMQMLHYRIKRFDHHISSSFDDSFEEEPSFKHNVLTWSFFIAIIPLCLSPLLIPNRADTKSQDKLVSHRTWIYKLDSKSKKLIRIGRYDDLGEKELEQLKDHNTYVQGWSCAGPNIYLR